MPGTRVAEEKQNKKEKEKEREEKRTRDGRWARPAFKREHCECAQELLLVTAAEDSVRLPRPIQMSEY